MVTSRMRWVASSAGLLVAASCGSPSTPPGTSLLKTTFGEAQGGPPAAMASAPPTRHVTHLAVAGGAADVEVRLDVIEGPKGRYLHGVEIVATQTGGGTLEATVPSGASAVNRGTADSAVASLPLMVQWRQEKACSTSLRQTMIEVAADGSATAR
jgi:hypothetical protein